MPLEQSEHSKPVRAFITGITGFAGSHLAELCLREGLSVAGATRGTASGYPNLAPVEDRIALYTLDLADEEATRLAVAEAAPDVVFHLAAETAAGAPEALMLATNIIGTLNLLEAAAELPKPPIVVIASSSAVYGAAADPAAPIEETAPLNPASSYGLAKAAQDALSARLSRVLHVPVVRARAFNHTGPRERDSFVASSVARQIAEAEAGFGPTRISVGRLDTLRDFSDVRDIARGYYLAGTRGGAGEVYNLASGRAVAIENLVSALVRLARVDIEIVQDPNRMRPSDVPCQIGDAGKAARELGWTPSISIDTSLADLLGYWREAISSTDRNNGIQR